MSEILQEKNKALLVRGFDLLFNKRDFREAEKFWSPNYIQHSGHIPPGRDGLFGLVKAFPADTKWDHGIIMAEGDFVMVHSRYSNGDGSALIVVDIMRIKDGSFVEHGTSLRALSQKVNRRANARCSVIHGRSSASRRASSVLRGETLISSGGREIRSEASTGREDVQAANHD